MACVDHRQIHLRAEILSEDGKDRVRREAHFPLRDTKSAAKLARDMLADAPDSIRKLFRSE
jgi:hydroxymethylbilane synthase